MVGLDRYIDEEDQELTSFGEEGVALFDEGSRGSSRGLGKDNSGGGGHHHYAPRIICSRWVALFLGLIVLAVTYKYGREAGLGGGHNSNEGPDQSRPAAAVVDDFESSTFTTTTSATAVTATITMATTPIPPSPYPTATATATATTTEQETQATTTTSATTPIPPSPYPTVTATATATTTEPETQATTTTAATTPIPPSPHPTVTATTAATTIEPETQATTTTAATTPIPPSPYPTVTATTAATTIEPETQATTTTAATTPIPPSPYPTVTASTTTTTTIDEQLPTSPSKQPTTSPSKQPSVSPSKQPTTSPSKQPTTSPSKQPSASPSKQPSTSPSKQPSVSPSKQPTTTPSEQPSISPSTQPTDSPSNQPSVSPSKQPSTTPSKQPSASPSTHPTDSPSNQPSISPSEQPWFLKPNPFVSKFNTNKWTNFLSHQWEERVQNSIYINENFGTYCPKEPAVAMCPRLNNEREIEPSWIKKLPNAPTVKCTDTGDGKERCGLGSPWVNKTVWPLARGPLCAKQDAQRRSKFPLPDELAPYMELGYDRSNTTNSADAAPLGGGKATPLDGKTSLPFDPNVMKNHFLRFEAMLEHYYEGLARPLLERQLAPAPDDPLYVPMLKAYADQIARALLRVAKSQGDGRMVLGVLGDSVTSGTDNCYYDAWPETLRRQLAPLYAAMGIELEVRNAAKNGGYALESQMLCAHDMLGASDRPNDLGLDFLFQCNPFVTSSAIDAEHLVRRALLGNSHTVVSITPQRDTSVELMLERYAAAGLTFGTPFLDAVPELGIPENGYKYWFPKQDRAFWGMQGDGFCHLTTRAGSSAVVNRNWHWGPKMHQTYADAYALLFSRATRQAIDDLSAGRMPPRPPAPKDYTKLVTNITDVEKDGAPRTWQNLIISDVASAENVRRGIGGVRCAVGLANQAGSTLLSHWLRPAEGSPFENKMKSRNGKSFVPLDHDAEGSDFYRETEVISPPNNAVPVGDWVENPDGFGAEAPRTKAQCHHVDGMTQVKSWNVDHDGMLWLVWEVPKKTVSIGRAMICHPKASKLELVEGAFDKGYIRAHYAVPNGKGGWRVVEDTHKKSKQIDFNELCWPVVAEMKSDVDVQAARKGGMWVAVEWKEGMSTGALSFDSFVAM